MSNLLDLLGRVLGNDTVSKMSQHLGQDEDTTRNAIGAALPALLGGLAKNASSPEGASALHGALQRDHDGSLLSNLGGLLNKPEESKGAGILGHVFGGRRENIERGIAKTTGMQEQKTGKLMEMLAPVVMGALGQEQRKGGLDANALAGFLGQQKQAAAAKAPEASGLIDRLLDADGDGDFDLGDMLKHGKGIFGKMLGK